MSWFHDPAALPYPGLRPFETDDHPIYFGREQHIGGLLDLLQEHRFVAVVGSSGSGKSSLVRAGLIPAVRDGFLSGDAADWHTLVFRPGHEPYERLARRLIGLESDPAAPRPTPEGTPPAADRHPSLLKQLRRSDRGLVDAFAGLNVPRSTKLLLIVDQFEELFAFRHAAASPAGADRRGGPASRDEAGAFVSMLLHAVADPAGRIRVVITMRSDFIGSCEAFLGLPEAVSRSQFLVPRLDRGEMEEAIVRPGQIKERGFEPFAFESGLVNRMMNDAGDRPDQLPLMQHALMRMWKLARQRHRATPDRDAALVLTHKDYEDAGGVEEALSRDAEAAWAEATEADPKNEAVIRRLFPLLCDVAVDGQIVRRRPEVQEVMDVAGASLEQIERVVRVFQKDDRNFLVTPEGERLLPQDRLDVSHEALLRRWRRFAPDPVQRLRSGEAAPWLTQERDDADELHRLVVQMKNRRSGAGGWLGPDDLPRVGQWRQRVSRSWAKRYVPPVDWPDVWDRIINFIEESQKQVDWDKLKKRTVILSVLAFFALATAVSIWFMAAANEAKETANQAKKVRTDGAGRLIWPHDRGGARARPHLRRA